MAAPPTTVAEPLTHPALRQQISRVPYLPGLDGLRAIAVIAVMVFHANHSWLTGGFLGVEVFFVISGYLITLLLIGEKERTGKVRIGQFWMRRARRLLPALFTMMGALAVYMALFNRRPMGHARGDLLAGTFYVSNWFQIWVGQGYTTVGAFAPLRHLWSLAVEEQFYLLWPLIMILLLRRRSDKLPRIALWLLVVSVTIALAVAVVFVGGDVPVQCAPDAMHGYATFRGRCVNINESLYLGTISRAGGLMLGAAFAMVWRPLAIMRGPLRRRGRRVDLIALVGLAVLALQMNWLHLTEPARQILGTRYDPWLFRGGFLVTGLCTLTAIAAATHRRSWIGRLLGIRPLNWVGTRSYGMYLYHWPIYQIVRKPESELSLSQFVIAMLITLPITELSYRLIEVPIRQGRFGQWLRGERAPRTKAARQRRRRALVVGSAFALSAGFASVSIATADLRCATDVECSLEQPSSDAGPTIPLVPTATTQPTTATNDPVPTVPGQSVPGTTVAAPQVGPTTPSNAIDLLPPVAIGESVMLGAKPQMEAGGIFVNAAVSRQGKNVAEILEMMRVSGQLGRTVIIQTGTNGSVSDDTYDRIMAALPPDLTPLVVFLTVKAPRGWIADNNTRIKGLEARYTNVLVVDWETAAQQILGELSKSDGGVHLATSHAKQYFANMIFDAIGRPELKR